MTKSISQALELFEFNYSDFTSHCPQGLKWQGCTSPNTESTGILANSLLTQT